MAEWLTSRVWSAMETPGMGWWACEQVGASGGSVQVPGVGSWCGPSRAGQSPPFTTAQAPPRPGRRAGRVGRTSALLISGAFTTRSVDLGLP